MLKPLKDFEKFVCKYWGYIEVSRGLTDYFLECIFPDPIYAINNKKKHACDFRFLSLVCSVCSVTVTNRAEMIGQLVRPAPCLLKQFINLLLPVWGAIQKYNYLLDAPINWLFLTTAFTSNHSMTLGGCIRVKKKRASCRRPSLNISFLEWSEPSR